MATAFQQNAFQDDAFQIGGVVPPTPSTGGGGGGTVGRVQAEFDKRNFIRKVLEKAIRESLEPPEKTPEPVKLITKPQRARIFPDDWKQAQILALLDNSLGEIALLIAQAVALQKAAFDARLAVLAAEAEDAEVAALVAELMAKDVL